MNIHYGGEVMSNIDRFKLKPVKHMIVEPNKESYTRVYWEIKDTEVPGEARRKGLKKIGLNSDMIDIVDKLSNNSDKVYIVGGAVRDIIGGHKPKDVDIATDLKPEQIIGIFGKDNAKLTGNVFPTVRVKKNGVEMEVSTFRKEIIQRNGKEGDRNNFEVQYADNIESDLDRRDLTINAIAINAKTGELIDPHNGINDIKNKKIRFVGDAHERIKEDPLRYLRAIRFKLRMGATYAPETVNAMKNKDVHSLVLNRVSKERIQEELLKALPVTDKFSGFYDDLKEFGMLDGLFPEIGKMVDHDGGPWHGETVYEHSMLVGDNYGKANNEDPKDVLGKLAAYYHDVGKPETYDPKERTFYEHDHIGAEKAAAVFKELRFSNTDVNFVSKLIDSHMRKPTSIKGARKMLLALGDDYKYLTKIFRADTMSNKNKSQADINESLNKIAEIDSLVSKAQEEKSSFSVINVNGNDLIREFELKPGRKIGEMLKYAQELVLENPDNNVKEKLIGEIKKHFKF